MFPNALLLTCIMVVAVALAGCVDDADQKVTDEPDPTETEPGPTVLPWGFTDCTWVVAAVPTQASAFGDRFPEGFTPMTPEEMGLPPQPGTDAVMGLEAFDCAQGAGLNGTVDSMVYSAYWSPVHPPENLSREGAGLQFMKWDVLIPDEDRRAALVAAGIPAVDGAVDLSGFSDTPAGYTFDISFQIGEDEHTFDGFANNPGEEALKNFTAREFTETADGIVLWDTRVVSPNLMQGAGTVTLDPDSFPATIVGRDTANAYFLSGTSASFLEGNITLPSAQ